MAAVARGTCQIGPRVVVRARRPARFEPAFRGTTVALPSGMRSTWIVGALLVVGTFAGCGGTSARSGDSGPGQAGAAVEPSTGGGGAAAGATGQAGSAGQGAAPPVVHEVAEFCAASPCPTSPENVTPFCVACPASPEGDGPGCKANIFGRTHRYPSSCGGDSVEVSYGFDTTVWQFDADGRLIGISWRSDTSSQTYGRQCTPTGDSVDLCLPVDTGAGGAGAGGAGPGSAGAGGGE